MRMLKPELIAVTCPICHQEKSIINIKKFPIICSDLGGSKLFETLTVKLRHKILKLNKGLKI